MNNQADNRFYNVPILENANKRDYVAKVTAASAEDQWLVHGAMRER
jgi:hypothetical protein